MNSKEWHQLTKAERETVTTRTDGVTICHNNEYIQRRIDALERYRITEFGSALAVYKVLNVMYPVGGFTPKQLDQMNADTLPTVLPNDTIVQWRS